LQSEVGRFCGLLDSHGVEQGETVLIFLAHGWDLYGSFVGCMFAGAVPSFMPVRTIKQDSLRYWSSHATLLQKIQPAAIIATPETIKEMEDAGLDITSIKVIDPATRCQGISPKNFRPGNEICLLQHSSGTTGLKKGVKLSYNAISSQLDSYGSAISVREDDAIASWLPIYHDMGLISCFLLPLYFGIPVSHIDPFYWLSRPDSIFTAIDRDKCTLCWMPNFAFDHLSNIVGNRAGRYNLSGMRSFISCSEPCRANTYQRFADVFAEAGLRPEMLQTCYAMAETVFAVTQSQVGELPQRLAVDPLLMEPGKNPASQNPGGSYLLSSGSVIDGLTVKIVDPEGFPVSDGAIGEISIYGDFLFSGYNEDQEKTKEKLRNSVYYTSDLGLIIQGNLFVIGRLDDMLIVNGRNMFAHEMEQAISNVNGLKPGRMVVLSSFDSKSGSDVVIVAAEHDNSYTHNSKNIVEDISSIIQTEFAVQPKFIQVVDPGWLLKTTSGKIARSANLEKFKKEFLI
jgi:acyl-CoA synthetase (AMP-forming)/AMP-acid ligase II